jgi:hypothetical protein
MWPTSDHDGSHASDLAVHQGVISCVGVAAPAPPPNTNPAPSSSPTAVAAATAAVVVGLIIVVKLAIVYSTAKDVVSTGKRAATWAKKERDQLRAARAAKAAAKAQAKAEKTAAKTAKPNPVATSSTGGRTVAYRVRLGIDPYNETIIARSDGRATLVRQRVPIATFRPTEYQNAKIRSGYGEVLVFTDQL